MIVSDGPRCLWRQVAGCIAAYALAVHGILVAFADIPIGTRAINYDNTLRLELCIHDLSSGAVSPETPTAPARNNTHCKFCVAGAHSSIVVPTPSGIEAAIATTGESPWAAVDHDLPLSSRYSKRQPRGPPLTA
jgi:hypothetical protein